MQSRQDKKCTLFVFCRDSRSEAAVVGSTKFSLRPAFGKDTATNFPVLKVQGKRKEETSQSQFAQLVQNRPKKQKKITHTQVVELNHPSFHSATYANFPRLSKKFYGRKRDGIQTFFRDEACNLPPKTLQWGASQRFKKLSFLATESVGKLNYHSTQNKTEKNVL